MKVRRAIISVVLILSILASAVVMLRFDMGKDTLQGQQAKAATYDDNGFVEYIPTADAAAAYGTVENPFTVLEIVPYAGYAEIGYLTGGKEPVDMERLCGIALGTISSEQISAKAARQFIEYLSAKHYMTLLTEEEAAVSNAKDAELEPEDRKFAAYQFAEKLSEDTKCYVVNDNSFLRESIGLKYVTEGNTVNYNEFDIETYEFVGWYEQGTDVAYDFNERIFTDIEVYAKWRLIKSNGEIIEPVIETPETETIIPATGYDSGITINFQPSVPTSLNGAAIVSGLPDDIVQVKTDGTRSGVALTEPVAPVLTGAPEAEDYILRGWYLDREGTIPYRFGSAIPEGYIKAGVMTLYPVWVQKSDCMITFDADLPEEVIPGNDVIWPAMLSNAVNGTGKQERYLQVDCASVLEAEKVPSITLLGNVDYKVKNYQLDIVTVMPQDLNKGGNVNVGSIDENASLENLALIEKANIIMLSPQSHFYEPVMPADNVIEITDNNNNKNYHRFGDDARTAVEIWEDCMNPALFEFAEQPDEGDCGTYGFLHNDLCWEVILAIFNETVLEESKAALIYDAESYHMALMNGAGANSESPKKLLFGEKALINVETLTGRSYSNLASSNNVYKLYLMMNQMNPNLFYATFLKDHIYPKMHNSVSTGCYNWSENTGEISNEVVYWNTATFLLCLLLDEADSNVWSENGVIKLKGNPWEKWGLTLDVHTFSDNRDDITGVVNVENGLIKGNCFSYESDVVNLTDYFATNASIPYQSNVKDVYDYYGRDDGSVTMSEIIYYLIQLAIGEKKENSGAGYDKDIRILELQPSESYLAPITWLWNINTYIDGFKGTTSVTQQSSVEFIGKIEDLNSTYDMLYIGSDISAYVPTRTVISKELVDTYAESTASWHAAGSTVVLAEKQRVAHKKEVELEVAAGNTVTLETAQMLYTTKRQQVPAGTYLIEVGQSQNLQVSKLVEPDGEKKYSDYVYQTLQNGQVVNIRVKKGDTVTLPQAQDMDVLVQEPVAAGSFTSPITQKYRAYTTSTEWMPAGAEVILAEGKTLRAMVGMPAGMKISPYSYFHTGAMVDMDLNSNLELSGSLGGNADRVNEYYYSGNDITKARMQEILEFAEAGYPVVAASRLMKRNAEGKLEVDTTVVDSASNMYLLLNTLATGENDPGSVYYGNFFYEGTTAASENYAEYKKNLLNALTETKCELMVNRMPVLYADGKPVSQSYINGAAGELENKNFELAFKITDAENGTYHLKFYIDENADGRYDSSERLVDKYDIYEVIAGRKQQVTQLKPNRNYTMTANLEDYVGVIPWKLEIVRSDNPVIRDSVIECSAILPADDEKPTLKVLHIIPDHVVDADGNTVQCSTIYLPTTEEATAMEWWMERWEDVGNDRQSGWDAETKTKWESFWNEKRLMKDNGDGTFRRWTLDEIAEHLKAHYQSWKSMGFAPDYVIDQMYVSQELSHMFMGELEDSIPYDGGSGGRRRSSVGFWAYMRAVQDFSIEVERLTVSEFIAETARYKVEDNGDHTAWALEMYDMMILGFNDGYQDIRDDDALDVIEDFIAAGKQILFTHDTTSFRNYLQSSAQFSSGFYWGYNINRVFREVLGMDRFGVTQMYPLDINGNQMSSGISIREAITRKNDAPYKTGGTQDISTTDALNKNVLNTQADGSRKYYVQGFSDLFLYRFENERYTVPLYTNRASKVNIGQLTEYPYRVGDDITVAKTHEQYYQLDMEAEDIVVWYTVEGNPENDLTSASDYAGTHHDVRNNYYLYSRGNVIYTGVGHDSFLTKDELKLFVNTFVASYRVPADPPTIAVQNSNATTADTEYFYIDFDSWDEMTAVGTEVVTVAGEQFQRVRFLVKEVAPMKNQRLSMEYYLAASSLTGTALTEQTGVEGETKQSSYYVKKDAEGNPSEIMHDGAKLQTHLASDGTIQTTLLMDTEYYVDIPLNLMNGKDGTELLFRACINYGRRNDQYIYAYQKIRFLRRGLFDLD